MRDSVYLDDPPGTETSYTVDVSVDDGDGGTDSGSTSVTVNNLAPTLSNLSGDTIDEGGTATVSGTITDPGADDTFDLVIDWGDGNIPETFADTPQGNFSKTHIYADDAPTAIGQASYAVDVSVDDGNGGTDSDNTTAKVNNIDPDVVPGPDQEGEVDDPINVSATFTDPRTLDAHTATIDWDDGNVDSCPPNSECTLTESSDGTVTGTHEYAVEGPYSVVITVIDENDAASSGSATVTVNIGRPGPPTLLSPVDDTAPVDPTFTWDGAILSDDYRLQISTDGFATRERNIGFSILANLDQGVHSGSLSSTGGAAALDAATLYEWRMKARAVSNLEGDFSDPESFVTEGNPVTVILDVDLEAPGTADDPVEFTVKLYAKDAFDPTSSTPWDLFGETPTLQFAGVTGSRAGQTITITLPGTIAVGFYDITTQANHTLVNVKSNVGVATNTGTIDMGTLLEGNAIDDDPATEPGSVINALDASLLAAAINEGTNDPSVDFTRNGTVDQDDLDLLKANYLRFSPIPV